MPNGDNLTKEDFDQVMLFNWVFDDLPPRMTAEERFLNALWITHNNSPVMVGIRKTGANVRNVLEKAQAYGEDSENLLDF